LPYIVNRQLTLHSEQRRSRFRLATATLLATAVWAFFLAHSPWLFSGAEPVARRPDPMDVRILELPQPEQDAASKNQNAKRQEATPHATVRPAPTPPRSAPRRPDFARPAPLKTESPLAPSRSPQTVEQTQPPLSPQPPAPTRPAETADTQPKPSNAPPPIAQQSAPGNSDTPSSAPARLLSQPLPELPDDLREEGYQFVAVARFVIHADGTFDVQLIKPTPSPRLNQILMQTLRKWRFVPATEAGHSVETHQDVRVHFNVD
jgi:protein TonB